MVGTSLVAPGGMTSVVRAYLDGGVFERWNVIYLASYENPGYFKQLKTVGAALLRFLRLLLRREVVLLHIHSASRGSFWRKSIFCTIANVFGVPYLFHLHSGEFLVFYEQENGFCRRAWVRRILRNAARVVVLTESWRCQIEKVEPSANIVVLSNPVEIPQAMFSARSIRQNVLFLGRLREKKGVFDLVSAIPNVLKKIPGAIFVLAGDGDIDSVKERARDLGVEHAVQCVGWVDGEDKKKLLNEADVFVLPSYFEGLPIGILEAMAFGVPVVTTPVGGIPDLIIHRVNGLLIEPGNLVELADAIVEILTKEMLRNRISEAAFLQVRQKYSTELVVDKLSDIYRSVRSPYISSSR